MGKTFSCANILIPQNIDMSAWSVVACDQHTSDQQYWESVKNLVGESPSTLKLIVPEVYLKRDIDELIANANASMAKTLESNILREFKDSIIYVERSLSNGKNRKGIIGKIDLEQYSEKISDNAKIRPSEQIVESRIPMRIKIRENACLDIPHILLFCDDKNKEIIEPLQYDLKNEDKIYDFNLNMNGGKIRGFKLSPQKARYVEEKMNSLISSANTGLIVADGNHSLVAAKRVYQEIKAKDVNYLNSPKRYALVEIVNIYDESIDIEPIYRVLKNIDCNHLLENMKKELSVCTNGDTETAVVKIIHSGKEIDLPLKVKQKGLVVEIIQQFLDKYLSLHDGEIDYIHELDKLKEMCKQNNVMGIVFAPIAKEDVFKVVSNKKLFPRKTFSIGTSADKRYYLECRSLI